MFNEQEYQQRYRTRLRASQLLRGSSFPKRNGLDFNNCRCNGGGGKFSSGGTMPSANGTNDFQQPGGVQCANPQGDMQAWVPNQQPSFVQPSTSQGDMQAYNNWLPQQVQMDKDHQPRVDNNPIMGKGNQQFCGLGNQQNSCPENMQNMPSANPPPQPNPVALEPYYYPQQYPLNNLLQYQGVVIPPPQLLLSGYSNLPNNQNPPGSASNNQPMVTDDKQSVNNNETKNNQIENSLEIPMSKIPDQYKAMRPVNNNNLSNQKQNLNQHLNVRSSPGQRPNFVSPKSYKPLKKSISNTTSVKPKLKAHNSDPNTSITNTLPQRGGFHQNNQPKSREQGNVNSSPQNATPKPTNTQSDQTPPQTQIMGGQPSPPKLMNQPHSNPNASPMPQELHWPSPNWIPEGIRPSLPPMVQQQLYQQGCTWPNNNKWQGQGRGQGGIPICPPGWVMPHMPQMQQQNFSPQQNYYMPQSNMMPQQSNFMGHQQPPQQFYNYRQGKPQIQAPAMPQKSPSQGGAPSGSPRGGDVASEVQWGDPNLRFKCMEMAKEVRANVKGN